uniref:ATP synthase F0 subunit 8 n=1 Tax=Neoasterolepisma foreli TaxID=2779710 RepID=A0A7L9R550_9INSE|nr:ATP synthase F0 subunit 8 [Neoasterolepisma foreli]QOL10504.1 ATP synthase F0 subunit 8 [Neoasterolepisma foreli]
MPQMYPLNWMMLFLMFITIYIMFLINNYYLYNKEMKNNNKMSSIIINTKTWKW